MIFLRKGVGKIGPARNVFSAGHPDPLRPTHGRTPVERPIPPVWPPDGVVRAPALLAERVVARIHIAGASIFAILVLVPVEPVMPR